MNSSGEFYSAAIVVFFFEVLEINRRDQCSHQNHVTMANHIDPIEASRHTQSPTAASSDDLRNHGGPFLSSFSLSLARE